MSKMREASFIFVYFCHEGHEHPTYYITGAAAVSSLAVIFIFADTGAFYG